MILTLIAAAQSVSIDNSNELQGLITTCPGASRAG